MKQGADQEWELGRFGLNTSSAVVGVDFDKHPRRKTRFAVDGLDEGELIEVVDHHRQAIGTKVGGDNGQTGHSGGEEWEGEEDVDVAAFGSVLLEKGGDVLGFKDGRDDEQGRSAGVVADLEAGELRCLQPFNHC